MIDTYSIKLLVSIFYSNLIFLMEWETELCILIHPNKLDDFLPN